MFARQEPGRGGLGGYNRGFQGGGNHPLEDPGLPLLIAHVTNYCVDGTTKRKSKMRAKKNMQITSLFQESRMSSTACMRPPERPSASVRCNSRHDD